MRIVLTKLVVQRMEEEEEKYKEREELKKIEVGGGLFGQSCILLCQARRKRRILWP